ncbi:hypothetical protein Mapa_005006 [Marchantia paleacea]|nr:hypothetical protein Mapa_005006 [Marchantia paleacea]
MKETRAGMVLTASSLSLGYKHERMLGVIMAQAANTASESSAWMKSMKVSLYCSLSPGWRATGSWGVHNPLKVTIP